MTIPGGTSRASNPRALAHDRHSARNIVGQGGGEKKHGAGPHNWGSPDGELADELAAQEDARREAQEAIADGDQHPGVQTYSERASAGGGVEGGSLAEEFAEKEGAFIARQQADPANLDLKEIARSSGATSNPTGDAVSSGASASLEQSVDVISRGKGTDGGFTGLASATDAAGSEERSMRNL